MNATFWIIYVVFGVIAQLIVLWDMRHCIASRIAGDPDLTFHIADRQTGERVDIEATQVDCDDYVVMNTIDQKIDNEFENCWKHERVLTIIIGLIAFCLWPISSTLLMLFVHKCTDSFVENMIIDQ